MAKAERDDKKSALDDFAQSTDMPPASVPAKVFGSPAERVFGAQKLEVYRDEARILVRLKALAASAGDDWYYRFPVKEKKTGKVSYIEGPSIKLTNDVGRIYGNCEIDTRVIDIGDAWLIYARFSDYETGYALTRPFQQRKGQTSMGGDADRARDIALQIGVSKAIRNVVCNALQSFADFAFEEAKEALVGKIGRDLPRYRDKTIERVKAKIDDIRRVEHVIGRAGHDWLAPDVARVIALMKAVSDGMATMDETFPPIAAPEGKAETGASKLDEFAKTSDSAATNPATDAVAEADETADFPGDRPQL